MISLEEIQAKLAVPSTVAGNSDCVAGELGLPQRLSRQLEFIAEVDKIKHILRRNLLTDGSRRENDAEHSWHLAMMAILLEEYGFYPWLLSTTWWRFMPEIPSPTMLKGIKIKSYEKNKLRRNFFLFYLKIRDGIFDLCGKNLTEWIQQTLGLPPAWIDYSLLCIMC